MVGTDSVGAGQGPPRTARARSTQVAQSEYGRVSVATIFLAISSPVARSRPFKWTYAGKTLKA